MYSNVGEGATVLNCIIMFVYFTNLNTSGFLLLKSTSISLFLPNFTKNYLFWDNNSNGIFTKKTPFMKVKVQ